MNKTLLAIAATIGLGAGAFILAGAASAQSYGGDPADATTTDEVIPTQAPADSDDTETPDAQEAPGDQDDGERDGGERDGRRHREGCNTDGEADTDTNADPDVDVDVDLEVQ